MQWSYNEFSFLDSKKKLIQIKNCETKDFFEHRETEHNSKTENHF